MANPFLVETPSPEVWTTTPEGIPVLDTEATLRAAVTPREVASGVFDGPYPWEDDADDDMIDIGMCWCGAYGRLGAVHNAKPSADEPVEECGTYR